MQFGNSFGKIGTATSCWFPSHLSLPHFNYKCNLFGFLYITFYHISTIHATCYWFPLYNSLIFQLYTHTTIGFLYISLSYFNYARIFFLNKVMDVFVVEIFDLYRF